MERVDNNAQEIPFHVRQPPSHPMIPPPILFFALNNLINEVGKGKDWVDGWRSAYCMLQPALSMCSAVCSGDLTPVCIYVYMYVYLVDWMS